MSCRVGQVSCSFVSAASSLGMRNRQARGWCGGARVFHKPTGMEPSDTLWLVASGLPNEARVWLNQEALSTPPNAPAGQFEITGLLAEANRIVIESPGTCGSDFPFDVRLGIVGHE